MEHCLLPQAERVAADILHSSETYRFYWDGKSFSVGANIGLAPITRNNVTIADVLAAADAACYAACYAAKENDRVRAER
jgi:ammonium transporter, Amt family